MIILFLHGWHSVPGGVKPTYLKDQWHVVVNPKLDDDDFELALITAQAEFDLNRPDVIVGSSRGGAVAMNINSRDTPLVLLCPAWKKWGSIKKLRPNSMILHSRQDDVIPFEDSEQLITESGLALDTLIEVGSDHRLADEGSLSVMLWACQLLVSGEKLPSIDRDLPSDRQSKRSNESQASSQEEGYYICDACGEEIVIPIDLSEGTSQRYIEDCPVCCHANIISVDIDENGNSRVRAEPEQDYD